MMVEMAVVSIIMTCSLAFLCHDCNVSVARLQHAAVPGAVARLQRAVVLVLA